MKEYELLYIVGSQFTEEEIGGIQGVVAKLLEKADAKILRNESLGKIRLAYSIKKIQHGTYILVHFDAEGSALLDVNRRLGLTDEVLRHTILERPQGAVERVYELVSYVAPLSEEAKVEKETKRPSSTTKSPTKKAPEIELAPPAPAVAEDPSLTMEELDQKLDKILEGDIAQNI
ncbi:30S ribosomal protein S6 [Candidatus Uhrbacteria bacterium]|nr:30S ribosomal protein S6 [Candidatus Uhrbacteria bacterium]